LTANIPFRRLARMLALALSLGALAAALLGASQTLAQTHRAACSTSGVHAARVKSHPAACPTHKGRQHHAAKPHGKHGHRKTKGKGKGRSRVQQHPVAARCENGSVPTSVGEGSFSCEDGSEPECENGATPTPSSDGTTLLCSPGSEREAGASEPECEENEEAETSCTGEPSAQACEPAGALCESQA
jgi:hypothetical protein